MSFRFHMKPVVAKPKAPAKARSADKAPSKASAAVTAPTSKTALLGHQVTESNTTDDEAVPPSSAAPSSEPAENAIAAATPSISSDQPAAAPSAPSPARTRTISYKSQDESASSADESRSRSKLVSRLVKARIKPSIPGAKRTPVKTMPAEAPQCQSDGKQQQPSAETAPEARAASRQGLQTPVTIRTGPDFKPSPHLVPAAPNCVPSHAELSSSEDEGVIDPYNPDHPLGHRENPEKCKGTKSPWIMKKFRSGVPTAMIDYLFYNPKGNPMVHDDDKVLEPEKGPSVVEEDVDDPEEEIIPQVAAPQLKLGPDGKFILDDTSLVVETTAAREGRRALQTGLGAGFSKRRSNRTTWTDEETLFFYKCLNSVGTDFAMMTRYFPHRTRHQIKLKFKLEEKRNPTLVDKALTNSNHYEISELETEFMDVSENAAKNRAQKRKPRPTKPREKKKGDPAKPKPRKRSNKNRKDYFYEGGSASDENSSSDDENDNSLRLEMEESMEEGTPKTASRKKNSIEKDVARVAYVDVVPLTGALNSRLLNPNALSSSQVNQLISQRPEQDKLKYGNSELAYLLNSPTIRERQAEKRKSPFRSTAVRRITLDLEVTSEPNESINLPVEIAPPSEQAVENRPVVEHIRKLLTKRLQESEAEQFVPQAEQVEKEPVVPRVGRRKSVNITKEIEEEVVESDEDDEEDEMESIAHALSKPTKSGRMPKLVDRRSTIEESDPKPKKPRAAPRQPRKRSKSVGRKKSKEAELPEECDEEPEAENPPHMDMQSLLNGVEPGSLVVIKSDVPNQPGKEMVQVFMVPPQSQGSTVTHNPDGSVSQLTINGVDVPLRPGMTIGPTSLVPIVAATTSSAIVSGMDTSGD